MDSPVFLILMLVFAAAGLWLALRVLGSMSR